MFSFFRKKGTIVIRDTLDWHNATLDDLRDDKIRSAAALWDRTFKMTFMKCRALIKNQAQGFLRDITDTNIVPFQIAKAKKRPSLFTLICDDDDWYHPQLISYLKKRSDDDAAILVWPDGIYGYRVRRNRVPGQSFLEEHLKGVRARPLSDETALSIIKTNNFALAEVFFDHYSLSDAHSHGHVIHASSKVKVEKLPFPLSIANRHPCSYTVLTNLLIDNPPEQEGRERLQALVQDYVRSSYHLQPEFEWAVSHIAQVKEIFSHALT